MFIRFGYTIPVLLLVGILVFNGGGKEEAKWTPSYPQDGPIVTFL